MSGASCIEVYDSGSEKIRPRCDRFCRPLGSNASKQISTKESFNDASQTIADDHRYPMLVERIEGEESRNKQRRAAKWDRSNIGFRHLPRGSAHATTGLWGH